VAAVTDPNLPISYGATHEARRRLRQERLYVLLQTIGWGGLIAFQLIFSRMFVPEDQRQDVWKFVAGVVRVSLIAWLLSHYVRFLIKRWGWRRLRWLALAPRILGLAFVLSGLWTGIGFGIELGLLKNEWKSPHSLPLVVTSSIINGAIIYVGWLWLYFSYHAFDRFNSSEIERLRLEASVKDAELRALKAQINPHFMFNALNSVRALVDEDPARARRAVTQLANLLRYSLQSGALETVSFEDELQVVNDYLALEQIRYEERLRLRIDVAPEALRCPVPPMLLQTLVENAVKYGVAMHPEGGEIAIRARCDGEVLRLTVTNPGTLGSTETVPARSTGLGLRNAANRLRLLFGEEASLQLRQNGSAVAAEVVMPVPEMAEGPVRAGPARASLVHLPS
jgi:signal transduction histidine kinase